MKVEVKYAPKNLLEVIYPNVAVEQRIAAYAQGYLDGHIILWGPNGTGKSTVTRLLPDSIENGNAVIETKDYDDLLGRKDLKDYLRRTANATSNQTESSRFYLTFEEFDNAKVNRHKLWTAMDACQDELMVIITTNHPFDIPKSVRDRCDLIEFGALKAHQVLPRAKFILAQEGLNLPEKDVLFYLQQVEHRGSLRAYMRKLNDLLALSKMGNPLPPVPSTVSATPPVLSVV